MTDTRKALQTLSQNMAQVMFGKQEALTLAIITLLGRGHLLIEDVPGVGKTVLARSMAQSIGGEFKRLQCTPDLLPSDITGVSIFNQNSHAFEFMRGPVFTNILLADEINRAPPRAQSALLECMAEQQVTVDGNTHPLPPVFMVIATQNPLEFQGTYALPEAELDRFFMRIRIGYPGAQAEMKMIESQRHGHPLDKLQPVLGVQDLAALQRAVEELRVADDVAAYALALVNATRNHASLALGASPRATLALVRAAQAFTLVLGGDFVTPRHIKQMARHVLSHRIILRSGATAAQAAEAVVDDVLGTVPVPA
jgi:MoxR-like ATPase